MIGLDIDNTVVVEQKRVLEAALSSNPKTQQILQRIIRRAILQARAEVVRSIHFKNGDPRGAAQSVRTSVYKKILGGNINIYNSRRAGARSTYVPKRHPSYRGGNRRQRNDVTARIMSYGPHDRGFILRWVNAGVTNRTITFTTDPHRPHIRRGLYGGDVSKYGKTTNTGNRGSLRPRNFFATYGEKALNKAAENISHLIDTELSKIMNKR